MRRLLFALPTLCLGLATESVRAQAPAPVPVKQFEVPWGREGRPRDPAVHPGGGIFFVGQEVNYVARLDPRTGEFKKYAIEAGANPHTCVVDARGIVCTTGNRNVTIGRLDPSTGEVTSFKTPDGIQDPHTMVWDKQGNQWFTAQNTIWHMVFDMRTKSHWSMADAGFIARADVSGLKVVM